MIISRRKLLAAGVVLVTVPTIACSAKTSDDGATQQTATEPAAGRALAMKVYKDPGCPCCDDWAAIARAAGYQVSIADDPAIADRKRRLGVPEDLWSCHTTEVGGFVLEGHVPLESLERLLASDDRTIAGLAVAGMPAGSPGMETASGAVQPYQVIAFGRSGERAVFADFPARG